METILPIQTSAPIQNHPETKPLFNELMYAVTKLSEASKGGEVFREILTGIETLSKEEKIEQLENAFSKYDELLEELSKPNLLSGHLIRAQQRVIIENNIKIIKNLITENIALIVNANSYETHRPDLFITSAYHARPTLTTSPSVSRSSTTPISTPQPQRSDLISDANGTPYRKLPQGGGGFCGDMAVAQVTNTRCDTDASRKRLGEMREAQKVFANSISYYSPEQRFDALKSLIPDFNVCKGYALNYIRNSLNSEGTVNRAQHQYRAEIFNHCQNYDDLWNAYRTFAEKPETQTAFDDFFLVRLQPGFVIRTNLNKPNNFLIEGEIQALMLDQGYVLSQNILPQVGADEVQGASTVLVFTHVIDGTKKYIACDSKPLDKYNSGRQSEGGHYIPVVPVQNSR